MSIPTILLIVLVVTITTFVLYRVLRKGRPPLPDQLRAGRPLPDFVALDESGDEVRSADLAGSPTIVLFVRGNWCPFCTKQVRNLAGHYKEITDLGARMIFITPKPLETTRRVAEFFDIEFDFWLDQDLAITRQLGLLLPAAVPGDARGEYGEDTVWPTALVVDANNVIRYSTMSKFVFDRPKPEQLVAQLRKLQAS